MDPVLLLLIGLSAFVLFRLISVLGTRTGNEVRREIEGVQRVRPAEEREAEPREAEQPVVLPPVSARAEPLRAADPTFDERAFLDGARAAYEMIIEAFAAGDIKSIRKYLGAGVYEAFKGAVAAREEQGRRLDLKFVGIDKAEIAEAAVRGGAMVATLDFISNQVRATFDKAGALVDGDPTRIDLVRDRWTFSRDVDSADPNWTLIATSAA